MHNNCSNKIINCIIAVIYVFLLIISDKVYAEAGIDERFKMKFEDGIQYLSFTTTATAGTGGIKYRTLGWQIAFNVSGSTYKMVYPMNDGGQTGTITREIPFRGEYGAILETLCRANGGGDINNPDSDDKKMINYMFTGGTVHIDAVQTIVRDGVYDYTYANANNGALSLNNAGQLQGAQTGLYFTYSSIAGAVSWSGVALADLQGYYNIPKDFSAEQVPHFIHYIYAEYMEGKTIYDSTIFKTDEDVVIAGINTKKTLTADDYTTSTRTFKSMKVSYDDNINHSFINITSKSISGFEFGATGTYNPNIYIVSFYEVKKPANPTATLGVKEIDSATVYTDDGQKFYTDGTTMNLTLVDKSFYDNLDINELKIKDIKTGSIVFTGTRTNSEYDLVNKPIGMYNYQMDITLENGNKISDTIAFEIMKGEEPPNESILKVSGNIDAPPSVLEVYDTADAELTFRTSSNYLLDDWRIVEGEEYVVETDRGDLSGYSAVVTVKLKIPVGKDVTVRVRVDDDSGAREYAEDTVHVDKKEIRPNAGVKIRMLKVEPNIYTSTEYKQYKKIKIDASYSDILTDRDVLAYASNDYKSNQTAIEIQPVTNNGSLDDSRLSSIKMADNTVPIKEVDKITIRGDKLGGSLAYVRFDSSGYYRIRNKVYNGVRVSTWSNYYTINVLPEQSPSINSFEIVAMQKDVSGNFYTIRKYYNDVVNMWSTYRNSSDLVTRFKVKANYTSPDDEILDINLKMSYDVNNDLDITNDGNYSNMLVTKSMNSFLQIKGEDVFRVVSKYVGQNTCEIIFEVSNTNRNIFGKMHFEMEAIESPIYPNFIEGSMEELQVIKANTNNISDIEKNIYIDNLTPNLSVETEKDSKTDVYVQKETNNSYFTNIENKLKSIYKDRLNITTFDENKVLPNITSKDTNIWESYSTSPYGYTVGNTSGNYQMGGMYTQKDGWIYYINGSSIRKFKLGTWEEDTLVCTLPVSGDEQISLANEWFYFDSGNQIWKINMDGTGAQCILSLLPSYYLNNLSDFVVKDGYLYFKRTYKKTSSASKKYEIVRISVDSPVLNLTATDGVSSKTIAGGAYTYENLTLYDKYLVYTKDNLIYTYNLSKNKDQELIEVSGGDPIGYNGYVYFYRVTSYNDHIYNIPITATDRDYDSIESEEGHIYNFNLLGGYLYFVKNPEYDNPLHKTMLFRASLSGSNDTKIDDASSGTKLYTMGGYIAYNGKKIPAWSLPAVDIIPKENKYGDNTNFSIDGSITGEGTVWVRCQIGSKIVKQTLTNPSNTAFSLNFNTKDFTEGVYKNIIVTVTTSNGVYNKADVGDITIRNPLSNLKESITGMPITGNNGSRIIFLDNDAKIDDNANNQTLVNNIESLILDRKLGIYASDVGNQIIKSLVLDFAGVTANDNYNLSTANFSEAANCLTNYIDIRKSVTNTTYFAVGRDELKFIKSFYDEDKDYKLSDSYTLTGKITKTNDVLLDEIKNEKQGTLKAAFEHDPSAWQNPVAVYKNANNGRYYTVSSKYDEVSGKHIITDLLGSEYLMGNIIDAMRGKWKVKVQAYDDTGNPLFDKSDNSEVSFYIHKPPIPRFLASETATDITLSDNGSYDIDMQHAHNNGIAKYKWRYLVKAASGSEAWVDAGEGEELKFVNILKVGANIIDYELTVWDLQGCGTSISKNYLILDAPDIDFNFNVGGNVTDYMYKGNAGREQVLINSSINWNDDAYNSLLYTSSGNRGMQITNDKEQRTNEADFNSQVLAKSIGKIEKDKKITVDFKVKNKYDITSMQEKWINVKSIYQMNNTNNFATYDAQNNKAFMQGSNIPILVNVASDDGVGCYDDFVVKITSTDLSLANVVLTDQGKAVYATNFTLPEDKADKVEYTINVYSKRTGELLSTAIYTSHIYVPKPEEMLSLTNLRVVSLKDAKLANYFLDKTTGKLKEMDMGVNLMAIDSTNFGGVPVTKGYKMLFKINSNNLNGANDKIKITPKFYTISGSVRDTSERDIYWTNSEHQVYKVGENAHNKYKQITLDNSNRTITNDKEATWQGEYLLPATAFAVPKGYIPKNVNDGNLKKDIIVVFEITAEKKLGETYNYNIKNWVTERTTIKTPYEIGDVIRYNYTINGAIDDVGVYRVR